MEIVDGNDINVLDPSWVDKIQTLGIFERTKIAIKEKNGREYAFTPVSMEQKMLLEEISQELMDVGRVEKIF